MAGDWIKVRTSLANDGRVRIAAKKLKKTNAIGNATTNAHCVTVFGALVTLWCLADEQADDNGILIGYDFDDINDLVGIDGFCEALPDDWILEENGWVKLPEYQQHNGKNAKKRSQTAKRVANAKGNATSVSSGNDAALANALPREEKRREEIKEPPITPQGGNLAAEKKTSNAIGIQRFLDECEQSGEKPIPADDPIFAYAAQAGIPNDFLHLCWLEFVERSLEDGKRKKSWRQAFRNCVRSNWYRLWWLDGNNYALTTNGKQAEKKHKGEEAA